MQGEQAGAIYYDASINTSKFRSDAKTVDKIAQDTGDNLGSTAEKGEGRASAAFGKLVTTAKWAGVAVGVAISGAIISNVDNAIKRVDTLNNSARTFENMGFTAGNASSAMKALEASIKGLPTPLDEAVRGMTLIASATGDIGKSQKIFSALNNAILGFGGNTEMVSNAVVQLSQDLAGGRVTGQTWMSLLNSGLGPALNAIAKQMGKTTQQLRDGLSDGSISVSTFTDSLINMNEKGGAGMKSFEQISKDATSGISTGWANLNTSITRGIAKVIEAIGSENISTSISSIGTAFESSSKYVIAFGKSAVDIAQQVGGYLAPKIETLVGSIKNLIPEAKNLTETRIIPLAQALGTTLVWGVGKAIDLLNALVTVMRPMAGYFARNEMAAKTLAAALLALWAGFKAHTIFTAFQASLAAVANGFVGTAFRVGGLQTAIAALKVSMQSTALFLAGPWALAIAAAIGIGALFYYRLNNEKNAIDNVRQAEEALAAKRTELEQSKRAAADASLRLEGAQLAVERATRNLMQVEQEHGLASIEYREAAHQKKLAEQELKNAKDDSKKASIDQKIAENDVSSAEQVAKVAKANQEKARSFQGLSDAARETEKRLYAVKDAGDAAAKTSGPNGTQSTKFIDALTGRAKGGPVSGGTPYIVGEKGQELFVPESDGVIIPNHALARNTHGTVSNNPSGSEKTFIENNIGTIVVDSQAREDSIIRRLTNDQEIVSHGLVPNQEYM